MKPRKPHHHSSRAPRTIGIIVAVVGIAVAQITPVTAVELSFPWARNDALTVGGQLVAESESEALAAPPLPPGIISPSSDPEAIAALQIRLGWTGLTGFDTNGVWDEGTTAAVKRFQWKHRIKQSGVSEDETTQTLQTVARDGKLDPRCLAAGIVLCVDKTQKVTRYVKDGQQIEIMDSNFGPEKGNEHFREWSRTREGEFKVFYKKKLDFSTLYGNALPNFMGFDGGEGFHFSAWFKESGYKDVSQGCVTTNDMAKSTWLFENTPKGTPVVVYH